ncbi:MAG: AAA family ATPase [Patescibacteria group bacterium]|nr:AAA family ATPase [Patescibacteria group bacterium]
MSYNVLVKVDFKGLVGQTRVKDTLSQVVEGDNLPQTLVFAGADGVGKVTCAKLLAKHLHQGDGLADTFVFSEILAEVREQGEKSPLITATRRMISFLTRSPIASKYKVAIIDDAQRLSDEAQNALLKTLEEPREDTLLMITVNDETKLLPTILSRARVIKFGPLSDEEIRLVVDASDDLLRMAQGSLGWVKQMQGDDEAWTDFRDMVDFWQNIKAKDVVERFEWASKKQVREDAVQFVRTGILVMRESLMQDMKAQAALDILRLQECLKQIEDNVNVRLALEAMLLVF